MYVDIVISNAFNLKKHFFSFCYHSLINGALTLLHQYLLHGQTLLYHRHGGIVVALAL